MANQGEIKYNFKFKAWKSPATVLWEEAWTGTKTKEEATAIFIPQMVELLRVMYEMEKPRR